MNCLMLGNNHPKLPSERHSRGNYDERKSSCDQWDNAFNYKHDISWRNNGDHVTAINCHVFLFNQIIRKCSGWWNTTTERFVFEEIHRIKIHSAISNSFLIIHYTCLLRSFFFRIKKAEQRRRAFGKRSQWLGAKHQFVNATLCRASSSWKCRLPT